jgi:IS30 family transposase
MPMSYTHLTIEERACIYQYYKNNLNVSEIANLLGRDKSTISRELRRNHSRDEGYNAIGAQRKYNKRRKKCKRKKILSNPIFYETVRNCLEKYWSPEQISNTLPKGINVSTSTIYRALNNNEFPITAKKKQRRYGKYLKRNRKSKGVAYDFSEVRSIEKRPLSVINRKEFGHWELDSIVLRSECGCHIASFVERKTRYLICCKLENKTAKCMTEAIIKELGTLPSHCVKTLTVDRGLEFTGWKEVEKALRAKVYFCDPYSPHQRGTNENTNGLIRQFFPRRKLLPPVTQQRIKEVQNLINERPRKILNFNTPYQKFLLHLT